MSSQTSLAPQGFQRLGLHTDWNHFMFFCVSAFEVPICLSCLGECYNAVLL